MSDESDYFIVFLVLTIVTSTLYLVVITFLILASLLPSSAFVKCASRKRQEARPIRSHVPSVTVRVTQPVLWREQPQEMRHRGPATTTTTTTATQWVFREDR